MGVNILGVLWGLYLMGLISTRLFSWYDRVSGGKLSGAKFNEPLT